MKAILLQGALVVVVVLLVMAFPGGRIGGAQDEEKRLTTVWVYRDIPGPNEKDTRTDSERKFQPFWIQPENKTNDVVVTDHLRANRLDKEAKGTVCEFAFRLRAREFAEVLFLPGGNNPGTRPGVDVTRALFLDNRMPVFLTFRARTVKDATVKAVFKIGGVAGRDYRDGLRFPEVAKPTPMRLTDQWREVSIDLKGKAKELESVICPLTVTVKETDNPGVEKLTVYIDDVRFEVRPKTK